jgi:hypothetical protein
VAIAAVTAGLPTVAALVSLRITGQRLGDFEKRTNQHFDRIEKRMDQCFRSQRELLQWKT